MSEKRCQKWCLFIGYVSGILARIISPDSKKRSWFSNPRKLEYFVAVCFSSPAGRKRANEPVNPFTVGTCRASGGLQSGFPAEMPLSWKKGCSKCTLLEYPLVIINLFRGERGKLAQLQVIRLNKQLINNQLFTLGYAGLLRFMHTLFYFFTSCCGVILCRHGK